MGMGVKHFRFWGTKQEIDEIQKVLPQYAADRWIARPGKIYDHMNKQLGVEIWEMCISKQQLNSRTVNPVQAFAAEHPMFMYEITWKDGRVIDNGLETFTNFEHHDPSFPGPFGALCKRYGVSYFPTEELRLANVERYNLLMAAKERNAVVQAS